MSSPVPALTALNDAAKGLGQQMVFWGQDVRHPEGNALERYGLTKARSPGLQGTSCYSMEWEGGVLELHGAVASWTAPYGHCGCVFCRDRGSIELWHGSSAPVPGEQHGESGTPEVRWRAFQPMLRWLIRYEAWVSRTAGADWRSACWRMIGKLPKGKPWLAPQLAMEWWNLAAAGMPPRARSLAARGR